MVGLLAAGLVAPSAHADGVTDQQQQVTDDLAEIQRLEQRSSELNERYLGYLNDKAALEAEIAAGQIQIDSQSVQIAAMQEQLASVAVAQFTGSGSGTFALFGDTASATDGLQREQLVRAAVNAGAVDADDYETQLEQLHHAQDDLTAKQAKVEGLAEQAASTLAATQQAGQAYQDELARDQARLGDLLVQEQQRQLEQAAADHAADVAKARAAQDQAAHDQAASNQQAAQVQAAQDQAAQGQAAQVQAPATSTTTTAPAVAGSGGNGSSGGGSSGSGGGGSSATTAPATIAPPLVVSQVTSPPSNNDSAATDGSSSDTGSSGDAGSAPGPAAAVTADTASPAADSPAADSPPPVSSRASVAVAAAKSQLGVPYRFAMSSPGVAFDCSGLTSYAWAQAGVSIPHQSGQQYGSTPHISLDDLQPGDLLFYYSPISHVSMYIGNGQVIQAPAPGKFVEIVAVNWSKVIGASRPG